jgi:hypothetical protein
MPWRFFAALLELRSLCGKSSSDIEITIALLNAVTINYNRAVQTPA